MLHITHYMKQCTLSWAEGVSDEHTLLLLELFLVLFLLQLLARQAVLITLRQYTIIYSIACIVCMYI